MKTKMIVIAVLVAGYQTIAQIAPTNMVLIPTGTFEMGSPESETGREVNETKHTVTLTKSFYMSKYEVTQREYLAVMGYNPSYFIGDLNRPVEQVYWDDAMNYCDKLTASEQAAGRLPTGWIYRLPTEAEWEYACRAGTSTPFHYGPNLRSGMANFDGRYEYVGGTGTVNNPNGTHLDQTTAVGSYQPNAFGLYDMHGNVWEWCMDRYQDNLGNESVIDPQVPAWGFGYQVFRGGGWYTSGKKCRSALRNGGTPGFSDYSVGFRSVLVSTNSGWEQVIETQPVQPTYGIPPVKDPTKDSLVVVTHGWIPFPLPRDVSWVDKMSNAISNRLASNWQVCGYHWENSAWTFLPGTALNNATQEGINLGNSIANQRWSYVHFIAHSAGAELIQTATTIIKKFSSNTIVHCTFLDPYDGYEFTGVMSYGSKTDWSDSYVAHGDIENYVAPYTDIPLLYSYNVDITYLDPAVKSSGWYTGANGLPNCSITSSSHGWPVDFYQNTITGNIQPGYDGFGFPLSKEGGNWSYATNHYIVGNLLSVTNLGTVLSSCNENLLGATPGVPVVKMNFNSAPQAWSSTGTILLNASGLTLLSGSPAWIVFIAPYTNAVNTVDFDANFTSGAGSQGLLTILWDADTIGTLDEKVIGPGLQHYTLPFPTTVANSTHLIGFRLDPFTNIQSVVVITNVVLGAVGVTQPFTLSVTTNKVNGLLVYRLMGQAGFDYGLQMSTNLTDWKQIGVLANISGVVNFVDPSSTNSSSRFYRAVAPY